MGAENTQVSSDIWLQTARFPLVLSLRHASSGELKTTTSEFLITFPWGAAGHLGVLNAPQVSAMCSQV